MSNVKAQMSIQFLKSKFQKDNLTLSHLSIHLSLGICHLDF